MDVLADGIWENFFEREAGTPHPGGRTAAWLDTS